MGGVWICSRDESAHVRRTGPEEEIVLLCAATRARRQATHARARRLTEALDWRGLTEILRSRRLLPTLGPRILRIAGDRAVDDFAVAVDRAILAGRRQGALLQLLCARITTALCDAGIPSATLKGPMLGEAIYGDPGRRPSRDIDLLVATEHLPAATEVVRALGYRAPRDHVDCDGLPVLHFALTHERGELPTVELHWRVHWYERDFARTRLLPPAADRSDAWRPAPADELAALLLFYARDGFIGLRLASDLSAWWDTYGARVRPGASQRLLEEYPALRRAILAGAAAAERVVGVPGTQIFGRSMAPGLRGRLAVRMANPSPRTSRAQLYADIGLVDWLLAPPGGTRRFIRRQVLIPREVRIERRAGNRRATSALGYGARVMSRYGLAIARLALARSSVITPRRRVGRLH
jgi:hypothetical protein